MSTGDESNVGSPRVNGQHVCPACGEVMWPHEETIIRLGHPERVRLRYRCVDPGCGASVVLEDSESMG